MLTASIISPVTAESEEALSVMSKEALSNSDKNYDSVNAASQKTPDENITHRF